MNKEVKKDVSKLKIIPLGGLEQIGMNITAFEYEDSIIVVDCGLAFPEGDMLGIDLVISIYGDKLTHQDMIKLVGIHTVYTEMEKALVSI